MSFDADRSARDESSEAWQVLGAARRAGEPRLVPRDSLFAPLVHAGESRPFVIAQLGQSLDGRIANSFGESKYINGRRGICHLHRLRALVDAVVIGASTALADNPRLDVRHVERHDHAPNPARVVIDRRGRVPGDLALFREDGARRVVLVGRDAAVDLPAGVEVVRVTETADGFAPADLAAALHAVGLARLLIEGGAETVSRFIDSGALDRLHLIVAPLLMGDGPSGFTLRHPRHLSDCERPPTRIFALGGDVLFDCDFAVNGSGGTGEHIEMAHPDLE
ncbi:RibD family protein [Ancylobacter sp. 6x-1]|uniref:RibD family protein n=1 Tax=Ancylobacter crimeensis TaxID=2579147 RepID=A0ABT0DFC1_9HYPH|nr:RibD family protein [Ancylobacter crimeensis]MCK0198653.1 RibD family protein [Ancylobacter crimeensis]